MKLRALIFEPADVEKGRMKIDAITESNPVPILAGPYAGRFFLDAGMETRDARWKAKLDGAGNARSKAIVADLETADLEEVDSVAVKGEAAIAKEPIAEVRR